MTAPRARPVLLALLGILSVALAAATLDSAVSIDDDLGIGDGPEIGPGSESPAAPNDSLGPPPAGGQTEAWIADLPSYCLPYLASSRFQIVALLAIAGVGYALYRKEGPVLPVGLLIAAGPFVLLVYVILTACEDRTLSEESTVPSGPANVTDELVSEATGVIGGGSGSASASAVFLLGVLAVVLVAAVTLLLVSSDDRTIDGSEDEGTTESEQTSEVIGRIAGRTADRIEDDASLENEVFRAWHEMTTYLDVANPESSSPGEFADAAVDAGMDREDVSKLTELFEEVRYGTAEPTGVRERGAVDALRRIEETYAEAES